MRSLAEVLQTAILTRPLTDDERPAIEDILDAAVEWRAGRLPLQAFAEIGKLPAFDAEGRRCESAGYGRWRALMSTPPDDPRRASLQAAIEALVKRQDVTMTKHGMFGREELSGSGAVVR